MFKARYGGTGARCDISLKVEITHLKGIANVILVSWLVILGMFETFVLVFLLFALDM